MKILYIIIMLVLTLMPNGNNIRYDTAVVTETYYDQSNITVFVTSDGHEWEATDITIFKGTDCVVKFDTNGTETVVDDVIMSIIHE